MRSVLSIRDKPEKGVSTETVYKQKIKNPVENILGGKWLTPELVQEPHSESVELLCHRSSAVRSEAPVKEDAGETAVPLRNTGMGARGGAHSKARTF